MQQSSWLTLVFCGVGAFLDVDVQLQFMRNVAFDFDANAQANQRSQ